MCREGGSPPYSGKTMVQSGETGKEACDARCDIREEEYPEVPARSCAGWGPEGGPEGGDGGSQLVEQQAVGLRGDR